MSDENKTRIVRNSETKSASDEIGTRLINTGTKPQSSNTEVLEEIDVSGKPETGAGEQTRMISAGGNMAAVSARTASGDRQTEEGTYDPIVGWVVVVDGPGKGCARQIYAGMNSVGRNSSAHVCLDFGDLSISRQDHAYLVYDDKQREYYVQHGGKANLVRLNNEPVLAPKGLSHGDRIEIGTTTLMFVPLCGENFDWNHTEIEASN